MYPMAKYSGMKVVLRNKQTGKYYAGKGVWSDKADQALDFGTACNALRECKEQRLAQTTVLVSFSNDLQPDMELPCESSSLEI